MDAGLTWLPAPKLRPRPDQWRHPFTGRGTITPARYLSDRAARAYVDDLVARTGIPADTIGNVHAGRGVDYLTVYRQRRGKFFVKRDKIAANVIPVLHVNV